MKNLICIIFFLLLIGCSSSEKKEARHSAPTSDSSQARGSSANSTDVVDAKKDQSLQSKRLIIYNVTVNIQAQNIPSRVSDIVRLTESYGGFALQQNSGGHLIVKIPSEKFRSFLENIKNSSEVYYEQLQASDVTEEFYDSEIRLDNARKIRARLIELLKQAKVIEEILKVETEINKISENIERLEGRMKYLSSNVAYSTITVTISQKYTPPKIEKKEYKPGILGLPFYYAYIGLGKLYDGVIWLFIKEGSE